MSYYGEYSNKTRGWKKKRGSGCIDPGNTSPREDQTKFRQSWAVLIQKVWEVDPLKCPKCGKAMKVVAIVDDVGLVEVTLRGLGLWEDPQLRGPPISLIQSLPDEVTYEPCSPMGWPFASLTARPCNLGGMIYLLMLERQPMRPGFFDLGLVRVKSGLAMKVRLRLLYEFQQLCETIRVIEMPPKI